MICFALLAHENEEVLQNQIADIRRFNRDAMIVLYNGGRNRRFGISSGLPVCPFSRPLEYGKLGRFLMDVMRWLSDEHIDCDYVAGLDSDVMFIQPGYERFLQLHLPPAGGMGVRKRKFTIWKDKQLGWWPGNTISREWDLWAPFFRTDYICGVFNPMQVYHRDAVRRILAGTDFEHLEYLLSVTDTWALEEILYATLAMREGGEMKNYPRVLSKLNRFRKPPTVQEVRLAMENPEAFFVHSVPRDMRDPVRADISRRYLTRGA